MHITYLDRKAIIEDYTASIRLKVHITQHTLTTHTTSTTESPVYTNASHFKPYDYRVSSHFKAGYISEYRAISKLDTYQVHTQIHHFFYHRLEKVSSLYHGLERYITPILFFSTSRKGITTSIPFRETREGGSSSNQHFKHAHYLPWSKGYHRRLYSIYSTKSSHHTAHTYYTHNLYHRKSRLHKCFAFQTIYITQYVSSHLKAGYQ